MGMTQDAKQDWHPADIKAGVQKAGFTMAELSLKHGYCKHYLSMTLHQSMPNGELIIAKVLKTTPSEIWPSRYGKDKQPLRGRFLSKRDNPKNKSSGQCLKERAA